MKRIGNINGKVLILGTSNRTTSKYVEITPEFLKTISTIGEWSVKTPVETEAGEIKEIIEEIKEEVTETSKKSKKKVLTEEELGL